MEFFQKISYITCFHCGDPCKGQVIQYEEKSFCCEGCRTVYEILQSNQLCEYYDIEQRAGLHPEKFHREKWAFLDDAEIVKGLLRFQSDEMAVITLYIPGMHCASCIYLLENLPQLTKGVISAQVNFPQKEVTIKYQPEIISLRQLVEMLCTIGYAPSINLDSLNRESKKKSDKTLYYKIGIAGFCTGNIMMLSMPEYLDMKGLLTPQFQLTFNILSAVLTLPVVFYSGRDYFTAAWRAVTTFKVNMELPLAMGLGGLFLQSLYNLIFLGESGYFDSVSGLIFMMLIGKFFQQRTYNWLSFDRDYRSYFPLAVQAVTPKGEKSVKVTELKADDEILIHHNELIPADSLLESGAALIDYSFVTGESNPVACKAGSLIYAGGRNKGTLLRLRVVHEVSDSYLTQLWNADSFKKEQKDGLGWQSNLMARWFTAIIIVLAVGTAVYWQLNNPAIMWKAVVSVLIVACPCVLALTIPFTYGRVIRIFSRNGFYLKNGDSLENLATADTIVFDKTGTLTQAGKSELDYEGESLTVKEQSWIARLTEQSLHPVSRQIYDFVANKENIESIITNWNETLGVGVSAEIEGNTVSISGGKDKGASLEINGREKGRFHLFHSFRDDLAELTASLKDHFNLYVLSGDTDKDRSFLSRFFPVRNLFFQAKPEDKRIFVEELKKDGHKVIMIGDGLNDAGALRESDFGISITNDTAAFTPASDAILDSKKMALLPAFASLSRSAKRIIYGSFVYSGLYNMIGIGFAMRGELSPLIAALLMPLSSISVVVYTYLAVRYAAKKRKL